MTPLQALAFVKKHGVVLESAHGSVPSLAAEIAGERIRGSWWGHEKGREIFRLTRHVRDAPNVLVCRLIDGRVTYVHRRLWPALLRLENEFGQSRTRALKEIHTKTGRHKTKEVPVSRWVPKEVVEASQALTRDDAIAALPRSVFL